MKYKQAALSALVLISLIGISFLSVGGCGGGKEGCNLEFSSVQTESQCESFQNFYSCNSYRYSPLGPGGFGDFSFLDNCKLSGCQFGCKNSDAAPPTPSPSPLPPPEPETIVTAPVLLTPVNNESIEQNNPNIGCPFDSASGFGSTIFFDWTESASPNGISGYHLVVQNTNADLPLIFIFLQDSFFTFLECNAYASDEFLDGWIWTVQGEDNLGNLSEISTGEFMFEPCRLDDGTPCNSF